MEMQQLIDKRDSLIKQYKNKIINDIEIDNFLIFPNNKIGQTYERLYSLFCIKDYNENDFINLKDNKIDYCKIVVVSKDNKMYDLNYFGYLFSI